MKQLDEQGGRRTLAVVLQTGDEAMASLQAVAAEEGLDAASFSAIGGFRSVLLGYFDWDSKEYREIPVDEQVEVVSLLGDVATDDGKPKVHAHAVVGTAEGFARAGHLLRGEVRPTLEVVVVESPAHLRRRHDPATGLALIDLAES